MASCTKRGLFEDYFQLLTVTQEEHGLREKPRQISWLRRGGKSLCTKNSYRQAQGTRDHITVLACLHAAEEDILSSTIYKGGYPGGSYNKEGVPNALYWKSPARYIDGELFRKWFVKNFLKFAAQEFPLLMMDGH